ncbi:D-2-hydroxyacid dehydrogenase [Primorskyibacter sp. 2E107]|uniref:D-2-hydroxyacid dehydrogenase n=1 Tax=Primorskyibacter sp. 2E107 TaxID=3403458 RepID=UPI003AF6DCCE
MTRKTVLICHELPDWSDFYVAKLGETWPQHRFLAAHDEAQAMDLAPQAQVYIGLAPKMTPALVARMRQLEWVQSLTTGIDALLHMESFPRGLPISRVVGVQGPQMAELALTLMLTLARRVPDLLAAQARGDWDRRPQALLHGKTLCLLGLGQIAETLALYAQTLGMTVTGVSGRESAPRVDRIFPRRQIKQAVGQADFTVVLTPLTPETRHIVDAELLAAMKPTGFLVNLARGGCVDETALLHALTSGQIAGAGIDVFETEPLPADNPLWSAPNIVITPHVGGFADCYHEQCLPTVRENFRRYASGGPDALADAARRS